MNTHPLTPRAQRAFARTAQAVSAARADFAAAQSALQKALARGVDVEATLSQATDVISEVPGTPLPKTLGPEEAAVERVYDRLGELLDTCKEYDTLHHELEVDTCLADAATNIQGDLRRLHAQWERCGDALKALESCLPSPPRGTPVDTGASAGTTFLVQGVEVMMPDFASTPTTPASELCRRADGIWCRGCGHAWHRRCTDVQHLLGIQTEWTCPTCLAATFAREDPTAAPLPPHLLSITAACDARGKEASTTQAHGTAIRRFVRVMHAEGVCNATEQLPSHAAGPGAPAASTSLASIVGFIAAASQPSADGTFPFAAKTIGDTVSALRSFHVSCGVAPAFPAKHPRIAAVLAGAKKLQRGHESSRRGAAFAVTPDHLRLILLVCIQRRQAALARNRIDLAYGASRDALFYALAYVACLRKSEAIRMKRRHLRPSTTHADAWDIHIPYTKNNQDGQQLLQDLTIAGKPAYGVNLHEIIVTHLALMDARGLDGSAPLFGDIRDPTRQLAEKGSTMMDRLHKSSPQHEAYYSVLERLTGDTAHRELGTKTHAFRRGGLFAARQMAQQQGLTGDGLMLFLKTYGRWKDARSVLQYLVYDRDEMLRYAGGISPQSHEDDITRRASQLALSPEPSPAQQRAAMLMLIDPNAIQTLVQTTRLADPSQPALPSTEPPPRNTPRSLVADPPSPHSDTSSEDAQEYTVETIEARRFNSQTRRAEYRVKWLGYDERTWEPRSNFGRSFHARLRDLDAASRDFITADTASAQI
ncbi:hypothetical protein RI054_01g06820 [Pseudoscourfieldia marina]